MSSNPSFNGQKSADEDVGAGASMRDGQLLESSAVRAAGKNDSWR